MKVLVKPKVRASEGTFVMKLLLIESGKIRKLKSLGSEWQIKATMGHIVELANDGDDKLGFTLDHESRHIDCRYVPRAGASR